MLAKGGCDLGGVGDDPGIAGFGRFFQELLEYPLLARWCCGAAGEGARFEVKIIEKGAGDRGLSFAWRWE